MVNKKRRGCIKTPEVTIKLFTVGADLISPKKNKIVYTGGLKTPQQQKKV